jgi:hypothetical protein
MVTVTPHLSSAIGVQLVPATDSGESISVFKLLVDAETALPARRIAQHAAPRNGGDVLVRVSEGTREITLTKPEPNPKEGIEDTEDLEDDSDLDSDEEQEVREIVWKETRPIAEIALKDVKARNKIEVAININSDLEMQIAAREVGSKSGVRVTIQAPEVAENGFA